MQRQPAPGDRSTLLAYLFWIFGFIGLHRFYLGRPISWRHLGPNNGPFAGRLANRPLSHSCNGRGCLRTVSRQNHRLQL